MTVNGSGFTLLSSHTFEISEFTVINGDMIISQTGFAVYVNENWRGTLETLEPGKGYIYKSKVTDERIFTFPTSN